MRGLENLFTNLNSNQTTFKMGKIKKGVISGLVGNLVLANYKGTQVVKQRPKNTKAAYSCSDKAEE
jgi:hypothetical protein